MNEDWQVCEATGHVGPEHDSTVRWRDLGLMCDACDAAHQDTRPLRQQLQGSGRTLERIRDHATSAEDPALLAQKELDRMQRFGRGDDMSDHDYIAALNRGLMTERVRAEDAEAEVEALQQQLRGAVDRVAELEAELVEVRESRDAWRLQAMREHDAAEEGQ